MPGFCSTTAAVPDVSNGQDSAPGEPQTQALPYSKKTPTPRTLYKNRKVGSNSQISKHRMEKVPAELRQAATTGLEVRVTGKWKPPSLSTQAVCGKCQRQGKEPSYSGLEPSKEARCISNLKIHAVRVSSNKTSVLPPEKTRQAIESLHAGRNRKI